MPVFSGTNGADSLIGGPGDDTLDGLGGDDTLDGGAGRDLLRGGEGNDRLYAYDAGSRDTLEGGPGDDTYIGPLDGSAILATIHERAGEGRDILQAFGSAVLPEGVETLILAQNRPLPPGTVFTGIGNDGDDVIAWLPSGGAPALRLEGRGGDDTLAGGDANDTLDGGTGRDQMSGGRGDDTYYVGEMGDLVVESYGFGRDTVIYLLDPTAGGTGYSQMFANTEVAILNRGGGLAVSTSSYGPASGPSVAFTGLGQDAVRFRGASGDDTLTGGSGDDVLDGGGGANVIAGGDGNDTISAGPGVNRFDGGAGDDVLRVEYGQSTIDGGDGNDLLSTDLNQTRPDGTRFFDGGAGDDTIRPGYGSFRVDGGEGDDVVELVNQWPGPYGYSNGGGLVSGGAGHDTLRFAGPHGEGFVGDLTDRAVRATGFERVEAAGLAFTRGALDGIELAPLAPSGKLDLIQVDRGSFTARVAPGASGTFTDSNSDDEIDLSGATGAWRFVMQGGRDTIRAGSGDDLFVMPRLFGSAGSLDGGGGRDTLDGIAGGVLDLSRGVLTPWFGGETILTAIEVFRSAKGSTQLQLVGSERGDDVAGNDGADTLAGNGGDDALQGGGGADRLDGGAGDDDLTGGAGDDTLEGGVGTDTARFAGRRADYDVTHDGASGSFTLRDLRPGGTEGSDLVRGVERFAFADGTMAAGSLLGRVAEGSAGADDLTGGAWDDTLRGGEGDDVLSGGRGADLLDGGAGHDRADYRGAADGILLDLSDGTGASNGGDAFGDRLVSIEEVVGSEGDDTLIGSAGTDALFGGGGADRIAGRDGNDGLYGEDGDDELSGGAGQDLLVGGEGRDSLDGGACDDTLLGGAGDDLLLGGEGEARDLLDGGDGDDTLEGGLGLDDYTGGEGADLFVWRSAAEGGVWGDRVFGFIGGEDRIGLDHEGFAFRPGEALVDGVSFVAAPGAAPAGDGPVMLYDTALGVLAYDADGLGEGLAVWVAEFQGRPVLTAADFIML